MTQCYQPSLMTVEWPGRRQHGWRSGFDKGFFVGERLQARVHLRGHMTGGWQFESGKLEMMARAIAHGGAAWSTYLQLRNLTAFNDMTTECSAGINFVIGVNGTGKPQLTKSILTLGRLGAERGVRL